MTRPSLHRPSTVPPLHDHGGPVIEEIPGLIKLHKNGQVERLPAMPEVPPTYSPSPTVTTVDVTINPFTGLWARIHVANNQTRLPVILYFHGGGFCVGSPAWRCYHIFLATLACSTSSVVVSPNYRLAPEHRLPAAYHDGATVLAWLIKQADDDGGEWRERCDFARIFVAGDSAGAAIAYHAAALNIWSSARVRGLILVQPFFSVEARMGLERSFGGSMKSALSLAAADCYWRLALPAGYDRNDIWCNPIGEKGLKRMEGMAMPPMLACVAELDILRDGNLELCRAMRRAGKKVEVALYEGVGHAFQVLPNFYSLSEVRIGELISDVKKFLRSN